MTRTILSLFFLSICILSGAAQNSISVKSSLGIEYAYVDIPADDQVGQLMFAPNRYYVYGDDQYTMIRKFSNTKEKTLDALTMEMITQLSTGEVWLCITIDQRKLRTSELKPQIGSGLGFNDFENSDYVFSKDARQQILGYSCENWKFTNEALTPVSMLICKASAPGMMLEKWPFFIKKDAQNEGICLGNDQFMGNTYKLRAQRIDVDQKTDLSAYLERFEKVNEAGMNAAIKAYLGF